MDNRLACRLAGICYVPSDAGTRRNLPRPRTISKAGWIYLALAALSIGLGAALAFAPW